MEHHPNLNPNPGGKDGSRWDVRPPAATPPFPSTGMHMPMPMPMQMPDFLRQAPPNMPGGAPMPPPSSVPNVPMRMHPFPQVHAGIYREIDTLQGDKYYYNVETRESVWNAPPHCTIENESTPRNRRKLRINAELIPGTKWRRVHVNSNEVYYAHIESKMTSWEMPDEESVVRGIGVLDGDGASVSGGDSTSEGEESSESDNGVSNSMEVEVGGGDDDKEKEKGKEEEKEEGAETDLGSTNDIPLKWKDKTHDERLDIFREMLRSQNLTRLSTWPAVLSNIAFDSRFTALPSDERRDVFNDYIWNRLDMEKAQERKKRKDEIDQYTALITRYLAERGGGGGGGEGGKGVEEGVDALEHLSYSDVKKDIEMKMRQEKEGEGEGEGDMILPAVAYSSKGRDIFYTALDDFIRKTKRERQEKKRKEEEKKKTVQDKAKRDFMARLEQSDITYKTSPHTAAHSKFIKESAEYQALSEGERMIVLSDYISILKSKKAQEEASIRKEREKRAIEALKLRELEQKTQRMSSNRQGREREERMMMAKEKKIEDLRLLIAERVKSTEMKWQRVVTMIQRDPRYASVEGVVGDLELKDMILAHQYDLGKKRLDDFKNMLRCGDVTLETSYERIVELYGDDKRFIGVESEEEKKRILHDVKEDMANNSLLEFRSVLMKLPSQVSYKSPTEGEEYVKLNQFLRGALGELYDSLDAISARRDSVLKDYIETLKRRAEGADSVDVNVDGKEKGKDKGGKVEPSRSRSGYGESKRRKRRRGSESGSDSDSDYGRARSSRERERDHHRHRHHHHKHEKRRSRSRSRSPSRDY